MSTSVVRLSELRPVADLLTKQAGRWRFMGSFPTVCHCQAGLELFSRGTTPAHPKPEILEAVAHRSGKPKRGWRFAGSAKSVPAGQGDAAYPGGLSGVHKQHIDGLGQRFCWLAPDWVADWFLDQIVWDGAGREQADSWFS
jgi:hypothetical protein